MAKHVTLEETCNKADVWFVAREALLQTRQATILLSNGRYFHGPKTHTVVPGDGEEVPRDTTWNDMALPAAMPCALRVDSYVGINGKGYVVFVYVRHANKLYVRVRNVGPDAWRERAWTRIEQTPDERGS